MEEKEKEVEKKETKENEDQKLPPCTTSNTAEHARASDDDEPCDDIRGKNIEEI